jgi:RimJ/RimL family protein N-acetyltransferase
MITAPESIQTPRLRLRRPRPTDADAIFSRFASDPAVTKYVAWPTHRSVADTRAFLDWCDGEWKRWPAAAYLIERREDGLLAGSTGLTYEAIDRVSTGYVLAQDAWGQGIATEALQAMVDLSLTLGVDRLHAICHVQHRASRRVLEKGGFVLDQVLLRYYPFPNLHPIDLFDVCAYVRDADLL